MCSLALHIVFLADSEDWLEPQQSLLSLLDDWQISIFWIYFVSSVYSQAGPGFTNLFFYDNQDKHILNLVLDMQQRTVAGGPV